VFEFAIDIELFILCVLRLKKSSPMANTSKGGKVLFAESYTHTTA
jgi:hypothetical protein